jgi:hypothetical protein
MMMKSGWEGTLKQIQMPQHKYIMHEFKFKLILVLFLRNIRLKITKNIWFAK